MIKAVAALGDPSAGIRAWSGWVESARQLPGRFPLRELLEEVTHRGPEEIMDEITALDAESAEVLQTIRGLL